MICEKKKGSSPLTPGGGMGSASRIERIKTMIEQTHEKLVEIAKRWAAGRHDVVLTERWSGNGGLPDVMAFSYRWSTMIEVKVSRNDFNADKRKMTRRFEEDCLGNYRIYCCPKGLLSEDDIPEKWGLLEVFPSGFARLKTNLFAYSPGSGTIWWHELTPKALMHERFMLFRALQDIHQDRDNKEKILIQKREGGENS